LENVENALTSKGILEFGEWIAIAKDGPECIQKTLSRLTPQTLVFPSIGCLEFNVCLLAF